MPFSGDISPSERLNSNTYLLMGKSINKLGSRGAVVTEKSKSAQKLRPIIIKYFVECTHNIDLYVSPKKVLV